MSNKRFTVHPFADWTLTNEDRAELVDISEALAQTKLEEYENYLNNEKCVDFNRWKKFASSGATTSYLERKKSNPESKLPELLMVGPLPGTLDVNMFDLVNPTLESMRIKASCLNDFSAGAVLDTIVWPTVDKPFRSVVVKWIEIDIPGATIGIVRNRDYVFLESSGILSMKNGERVGYHLFLSVTFPQTHKLPNRVRGNMSLCAIFHQEDPDKTDCRGTGIMDPGGELIRILGVMGMVQATLASVQYPYCGQMKKLVWLLEQRHADLREQGGPVVKPECMTCSKQIKSSKLKQSKNTCKLCFGAVCRSCRVSKKLSFITPDLELSQRKMTFCVQCLLEVTKMDTLEAARQQFVYNTQPRNYSPPESSAYSDSTVNST